MEFRGVRSKPSATVTFPWTLTTVQHLWSWGPLLYIEAMGPGDHFPYLSRFPFPSWGVKGWKKAPPHWLCGSLMWANLVFAHHSWVETLVEIVTGPPNARSGKAEVAEAGRVKEGPGSSVGWLFCPSTHSSHCVRAPPKTPKWASPRTRWEIVDRLNVAQVMSWKRWAGGSWGRNTT